ncbi:MAG: hypothetical protein ABI679_10615, partial [Gemmatimonadota bacterium]
MRTLVRAMVEWLVLPLVFGIERAARMLVSRVILAPAMDGATELDLKQCGSPTPAKPRGWSRTPLPRARSLWRQGQRLVAGLSYRTRRFRHSLRSAIALVSVSRV